MLNNLTQCFAIEYQSHELSLTQPQASPDVSFRTHRNAFAVRVPLKFKNQCDAQCSNQI